MLARANYGMELSGDVAMLETDVSREAAPIRSRNSRVQLVWLLLVIILLRYGFIWADTFAGASLPRIGSTGFTAIFAAFSILRAADLLGWRRALLFLFTCVTVSWCFEAVGVATGAVYGSITTATHSV